MIWLFLDQFTNVKYKIELRFEWCAIYETIYFELEKELFNCFD